MTPEFRSALFAWRCNPEKDGSERLCIPVQLQRLFARLCLSECAHVETKSVTESFGWSSNEVFQQQDVQELTHVLLDALDKTFSANGLENPITPLYRGLLHDYLRCTECNYSSMRSAVFINIPLVIRSVSSLEEALELYMTPELLDKSNQWFCEKCGKIVNALKGLLLKELPPILTFQLERFDYNYSTMARIKLNHRVTFPFYLDMSKYHKADLDELTKSVHTRKNASDDCHPNAKQSMQNAEEEWSCALCTYINVSQRKRCEMCDTPRPQLNSEQAMAPTDISATSAPMSTLPPPPSVSSEYSPPAAQSGDAEQQVVTEPPKHIGENDFIYELFSVMIHSGGAMGGHYYAYIKSMKTGRWYNFNDNSVTNITEADVQRMFGEGEKRLTSSNAYLLMYRRLKPTPTSEDTTLTNVEEPQKKQDSIVELDMDTIAEIPEDLRKEIEEENKKYAEDKAEYQRKMDTLDLRVFYGNTSIMIHINKFQTLRDAKKLAYREANVNEAIELSCVRLRSYNSTTGTVSPSFPEDDESKTLTDLGIFGQRSFFLETKSLQEEWPSEQPESITINVIQLNEATLELEPAVAVTITEANFATLDHLRSALQEKTKLPNECQLLLRVLNSDVEIISGDAYSKLINDCKLNDGSLIYVEQVKGEGLSMLKQRFEAEQNTIELTFNNPNTGEEDIKIAIDQRETIGTLKKRIGAVVGLPEDQFRLRRKLLNKEYKNESETLQQCYLFDGSALLVEKGRSLRTGEILAKIYLHRMTNVGDAFENLIEVMIVTEGDQSDDLKARVRKHLSRDNLDLPWNRIRIREKVDGRLGAAMRQGKSLKQAISAIRDGVELALQVIEDATTKVEFQEDEMILEMRRFCPDIMELKSGEELILGKDSSVLALRSAVAANHAVPVEYIVVAKPFKHQLGLVSSLLTLSWEVNDDALITKSPLYLRDGDLMLWRDLRDVPKEVGSMPQLTPSRPKETGIVIRTVHDHDSNSNGPE